MGDPIGFEILDGYLPSFVQHLQDTRARLGPRAGLQANASQATDGDVAEEDGTNATGWTSAEQDAFFRAVSVHSRWRPDLIAACVPTKSEWDVWMYMEALEEGAATLAAQREDEEKDEDMNMNMDKDEDEDEDEGNDGDEDEDEDEGNDEDEDDDNGDDENAEWDDSADERREMEMEVDSDSRAASGPDENEDMGLCEPALEVSQAWIDVEERMASWIIHQEHLASVDVDVGTGAKNKNDAKDKNYRPRTGKSQRKREVLMGCLGLPDLQVLENFLREGEQVMKEQNQSQEGSVTLGTPGPSEYGDDEPSHPRDVGVTSLSDRITEPQGTINIPGSSSVMAINPVVSEDVDPTGRRSCQVSSGDNETSGSVPVQGSSLSLSVSSASLGVPPGNAFTFPQDNAVPTESPLNTNAESDLSSLSPRSRRQIQKRLYMRRKRALLRGDNALEAGNEKLKPGKKAKIVERETSVVSSIPCSEGPSDAEGELPENMPKNKSGMNIRYKLRAQFAGLGVDATYLAGQGMDLLNLGALGKLIGLWQSLEYGEGAKKAKADGATILDSIDAQLIRYLQAAVVSFVTDVIHRVIVWRERERRLKQRNQAWRQGDQIAAGTVEHAVEIVGARYHSHKAYFRALEAHYSGLSTEASANATDEPDPREVSVDPGAGVSDLVYEPPRLSVHRDVYTPRIYPPYVCRTSPLSCLTRTYEREALRTRRGPSAEIGEDELMPDETDEEALEDELEDEEEVDGRDMMFGEAEEVALFGNGKKRRKYY